MKFRICNQKGFSIIDSILATVVLAIGLTGGIFLMQNALVASNNADYSVIATQFASEKLETIIADKAMKAGKYAAIINSNYPEETLSYNESAGTFKRTVAVNEVSSADLTTLENGSGFKRVDVEVKWGPSYSKKITVSTLLTNY